MSKNIEFNHTSVLYEELINSLKIKPDGIYVDCTLGGGGHAGGVCEKLDKGRLIGIDQDEDALSAASEHLDIYKDKVTFVKSNYSNIVKVLSDLGIEKVDGIYIDLGVSSYQLDNAKRGFSYRYDSVLDMRMDKEASFSAYDVINGYDRDELAKIIKDYGEEKFAYKIASKIVDIRKNKNIETTKELVDIIKTCIPQRLQREYGHPAKRTFQAIRIEVNDELGVLKNTLNEMIDLLNIGGRLSVISFHSLEDRIVKHIFNENEHPCTCPPNFPVCVCNKKPKGKVIGKMILPSEEEMNINPRSKSAKLRVFEKI